MKLPVPPFVALWLLVGHASQHKMSVEGFSTTPSVTTRWRASNGHSQNQLLIGGKWESIPGFHYSNSRCRRSGLELRAVSPSAIAAVFKALHANPSYVATAILWLSTFGTSLERRTVIGKALSAPLATMALALTVANLGVIPFHSTVYSFVNRYVVALAVPLLLFDSDLRRVISDTGTLLAAFAVGAFATVIGTLVAFPLIPLKSLGPDVGWRVACALAARHIGGAINFVAVAETLNIGGNAVAAASKFNEWIHRHTNP